MKKVKMTEKKKLNGIRDALRQIIGFPPKGYPRRTKDGYPLEFIYDEWAYKRMVRSYRDVLRDFK